MGGQEDLYHNQGENEEYASEQDEEYDEDIYDNDEFEEENQVIDEENDTFEEHPKKKIDICTILREEDIRQRQEEGIERVCSILSISKDEAVILLLHFRWNFQRMVDEWLVKEDDIRRDLGLLQIRVSEVDPNSDRDCGVCGDSYCISGMRAGACGHYFCNGCWLRWIQARMDQVGAGCLRLKCLEPSCKCAIGEEMVLYLLTYCEEHYLKRYRQYLVRSYVESNKEIKWCPAPGCEYAVEVVNYESGSGSYEVTCKCRYEFCWNCSEEVHRPVDCEIANKWMVTNNDNEQTENWKLVNTKPCPKCNSAIEKIDGCMHMTCVSPCCFEFCWLCLGNWSNHYSNYPCNWSDDKDDELQRKENRNREAIKKALEMYNHYYERWVANESSRRKALSDIQTIQNSGFQKLSISHCQSDLKLQFITDAWLQIVECRRVLKWTYAYGYYLAESEHAKDRVNKNLFEHLQAHAESSLERLHECAEQELKGFISHEKSRQDFFNFRKKLINLTNVTGNYFKNLVEALEKDSVMYDIESAKGEIMVGAYSG